AVRAAADNDYVEICIFIIHSLLVLSDFNNICPTQKPLQSACKSSVQSRNTRQYERNQPIRQKPEISLCRRRLRVLSVARVLALSSTLAINATGQPGIRFTNGKRVVWFGQSSNAGRVFSGA